MPFSGLRFRFFAELVVVVRKEIGQTLGFVMIGGRDHVAAGVAAVVGAGGVVVVVVVVAEAVGVFGLIVVAGAGLHVMISRKEPCSSYCCNTNCSKQSLPKRG